MSDNKLLQFVKSAWAALNFTSGKFSHLKMWSNVALACATWVIISVTLQEKLTVDLFVVYLGASTGARITDKYLYNKTKNQT